MLGDVARQLHDQSAGDDRIIADKIEVGVMRGSLTQAMYALLKDYMPADYKEVYNSRKIMKSIEFSYSGVPVTVKIFNKDHGVFGNLNLRFYDVESILLPNPFEVYWQKRGIL